MSDRGAMIALRIDTERIREVAPLHLKTVIVSGKQRARIVAPAAPEYRAIAVALQRCLAERTGVTVPVLGPAQATTAAEGLGNIIAIGHAGNNPTLRRMHDLRLLVNRDYPQEGHRLRSIHSPEGDGHNVLAVLGADPDTAQRSANRLLTHLCEDSDECCVNGFLFDVAPLPETPDPKQFLADNAARKQSAQTGHPTAMLTALKHLNATGREDWGRAFIEVATPFATGEIPLAFWLMSAVDFWTDALVIGWDQVEELPCFSTEERRLMANLVLACTAYCHDSITHQKWRATEEDHQVFNHHTFPARGLYFGCMYLRRHGYESEDLDAWLAKVQRVFGRAREVGRSYDEGGGGYSWLVGNHTTEVALAQGDTTYNSSPEFRSYADLAVVVLNNRFESVPFGDCGSYHGKAGWAAELMLRAAEWHRDPGLKWVAGKCAPEADAADILTRQLDAAAPKRYLGLFVLPLDPVIHRWTNLPRYPGYPPPLVETNVPVEGCFDKISFRGGWDADDDYLLLQGFGDGQHGHPDANAISQYQVRGRLFLVDNDYILRMPKQHNMAMVIRDGQHVPIPVTARLDLAAELDSGALTQTTLSDYNGCDWTRTLLWQKSEFVLVVDTLQATVAGDYDLRCYWRTLGDADLTPQGLHADHDGQHFHIIELTKSHQTLAAEDMPLNAAKYPEYEFGDGRPKVLCQRRGLRLEAGERVRFVNLLLPTDCSPEPCRTVRWREDGGIGVVGGPATVSLTREGVLQGNRWLHRFTKSQELDLVPSVAPVLPRVGEQFPAIGTWPIVWEAKLPAPATCIYPLLSQRALAGCLDGSVVNVSATGEVHVLGQAEDRIGAVIGGRLYGEEHATYLAAGYDATLRLYRPDGEVRACVELPECTHMPAWGRALCLADLDGDGGLWPIVGTAAWQVHAVAADGTLRWTFDTAAHSVRCLASGDLNGDGRDEVAIGTVYFCVPAATADGERLWQDEDYNDFWRAGPCFPYIHMGDVDGDGQLEVLTVGTDTLIHCISAIGEKKWTYSIGDDPTGLVLLDGTVVAASCSGGLHCVAADGTRRWHLQLDRPCTALTVAGNAVIVATEGGGIARVTADGEMTSRTQRGATITHLDVHDATTVVAASEDGVLAVVRPPE